MKACGFLCGQFGDLVMGIVALKSFRRLYPDAHFTLSIGNRYAEIKPLFEQQKNINSIHIWDSYNEWPNPNDKAYIKAENFDILYDGMAEHKDQNWYWKRHQTEELQKMMNLPIIEDRKIELKRWFNVPNNKDCVAIAGFTSFGACKSLSVKKLINITNYIKCKRYKVVQLGLETEPEIPNICRFIGSYFESVRQMLGCKLLVCADTGLAWVSSAYNYPTLGLYGYNFYPMCSTSKNWQPMNDNAVYLEADHAENIKDELIYENLNQFL